MESNSICKKHNKVKESSCGTCQNCEPMCIMCIFEHNLTTHGISTIPFSEVVAKKIENFTKSNMDSAKVLDDTIRKLNSMIKEVNEENTKCKTYINSLFKQLIDLQDKISLQYNLIIQSLLVHLSQTVREKLILNNVRCIRENEIKQLFSDKKFYEANGLLELAIKNKKTIDINEFENCLKNDSMKIKEFDLSNLREKFSLLSIESFKKIENERNLYKKEIDNLKTILDAERLKFKNDFNEKLKECIFHK